MAMSVIEFDCIPRGLTHWQADDIKSLETRIDRELHSFRFRGGLFETLETVGVVVECPPSLCDDDVFSEVAEIIKKLYTIGLGRGAWSRVDVQLFPQEYSFGEKAERKVRVAFSR